MTKHQLAMATSSTYSPTGSNSSASFTWQERLEGKRRQGTRQNSARLTRLTEVCRQAKLCPPVFQLVSDRRGMLAHRNDATESNCGSGGRTAWSSRVIVHGKTLEARYWYDGKNLNNAREDAAECAINWLSASSGNSSWSHW